MYDELIEIRNKVDKLIEECQPESEYVGEFEYVGELYGKNGKYALYLSPKHTESILNWIDAKKYCKLLNAELPTIGELQYLYDNYRKCSGDTLYWSSTNSSSSQAESLAFISGLTYTINKYSNQYIRAVRRVKL
jgi:formylglycine-generating enzyme required for sulfatase activity